MLSRNHFQTPSQQTVRKKVAIQIIMIGTDETQETAQKTGSTLIWSGK